MSAPRLLILETSGRRGQVGLAEGAAVVARRALDEGRRNARDLAPAVRDVLAEQGWTARDLAAVVVGTGPGSYTGLRVGIVSAKALAYATGASLVGVPTFEAIARDAPGERLDVIADAQKENAYAQSFFPDRPPAELRIVAIAEYIAGRDPEAIITGPGLAKYGDRLPPGARRLGDAGPTLEAMLACGLERLAAGRVEDVFGLEPLYLRPSSAEEQWRGRP